MWKFDLTRRSAMIIGIGIALNYLLFLAAHSFQLPLWLDTTGTAYTALFLGPSAGLLVALVNNLILAFGYYGPITFPYFLISAMVAVVVGFTARRGQLQNYLSVCGLIAILYLLTAALSVMLQLVISDGEPGDYWGGMIFCAVEPGCGKYLAALIAFTLVKLPDTIVSALLVVLAWALTPGKPLQSPGGKSVLARTTSELSR